MKERKTGYEIWSSVEYNNRNIFLKNHAENKAWRIVSDLFLFFKTALYEVKANELQLSFNIFREPLTWHIIKTNCIKLQTIDSEICSILIL